MSDGNGDSLKKENQEAPVEKTPEQLDTELDTERLERYQKDPKQFVELSDVVLLAIRNPNSQLGLSVFTGGCKRSELDIAQVELNHTINKMRISMDIKAEMKKAVANNLLVPKKQGGILPFVRGRR